MVTKIIHFVYIIMISPRIELLALLRISKYNKVKIFFMMFYLPISSNWKLTLFLAIFRFFSFKTHHCGSGN